MTVFNSSKTVRSLATTTSALLCPFDTTALRTLAMWSLIFAASPLNRPIVPADSKRATFVEIPETRSPTFATPPPMRCPILDKNGARSISVMRRPILGTVSRTGVKTALSKVSLTFARATVNCFTRRPILDNNSARSISAMRCPILVTFLRTGAKTATSKVG
jgi:hypothetical protein